MNDAFFARPPDLVAKALLGARLLVNGCVVAIVEIEAYGPDDEASNSFKDPTKMIVAMSVLPYFARTRAYAVLMHDLRPSEEFDLAPNGEHLDNSD